MKVFNLISDAIKYNENTFFVFFRHIMFPIYLDHKGSDKWVLFFPGACNREKTIPIFQRSSYSKDINANVLSFFDPTLFFNKKITNAWFSGPPNSYYADVLGSLLKKTFQDLNVNTSSIVLFGTSAGGLPAFCVARHLKDSTVIGGNIQTKALKHNAFKNLSHIIFRSKELDVVYREYQKRFDISLLDGDFHFYLMQNKSDTYHYNNHYSVFKDAYKKTNMKALGTFLTYDDPKSGHGSVGREKEINLINEYINTSKLSADWLHFDK